MAFQPPPRTSTGWVFREILRPFACLSVLSPAVWLACKISPAKEAERLRKQGEEKSKFNKLKFKVMHSKIFQITETRVSKDNYLNEDTLTQGDDSFFDYCAEIDDEERQFHIDNLVNNILPKGMFELVSDDTIRYKGGAERWREDFIADIRSRAEAPTPESVQDWIGPVYQLEKFLKNPLDTAYWFYMDEEGLQSNAEQSYEFLRQACEFKPGTLLYIGGVIDYHF